jgi:hypothetical protein
VHDSIKEKERCKKDPKGSRGKKLESIKASAISIRKQKRIYNGRRKQICNEAKMKKSKEEKSQIYDEEKKRNMKIACGC